MSVLRRRGLNTDIDSVDKASFPDSKSTTSKSKRSGFSIVLASLVLLSSAIFLASRIKQDSDTVLPTSYAVCSEDRNIYTVDESNPRVECCLVANGRIAGIGSFCMTFDLIHMITGPEWFVYCSRGIQTFQRKT